MTIPESLRALSDADLIEKLAVDVMGWRKGPIPDSLSDTQWWWSGAEPVYTACAYRRKLDWKPLTDWNHTMEVVGRIDGWLLEELGGLLVRGLHDGNQRELCLAALHAISK